MAEDTFLNEAGVTVTNSRFIVPAQTYAMSGITAVKSQRNESSRICPVVFIALGVGVILSILSDPSTHGTYGINIGLIVGVGIGIVIVALGIFWLLSLKPTFSVVLSSASGESTALTSKDSEYISRIIEAINNAIIARG